MLELVAGEWPAAWDRRSTVWEVRLTPVPRRDTVDSLEFKWTGFLPAESPRGKLFSVDLTGLLMTHTDIARSAYGSQSVIREEVPGMATVPELARLLGISPSTAYRWIRQEKLLAWEHRSRLKGPADQVLGPGHAVPGLDSVTRELDMPPELVWDFVSNPWRWAGGAMEPPLCKLRRGEIQEVLDAAPAYLNVMG